MRDRKWKSKPQSWRCSYLEKLSSEERKVLITQYEVAMSARELARKHNVSVDSLNAYLRRWGVRLR